MIRKVSKKGKKPKWVLYSKNGDKRLGEFATLEAAKARERQINYWKSKKG